MKLKMKRLVFLICDLVTVLRQSVFVVYSDGNAYFEFACSGYIKTPPIQNKEVPFIRWQSSVSKILTIMGSLFFKQLQSTL